MPELRADLNCYGHEIRHPILDTRSTPPTPYSDGQTYFNLTEEVLYLRVNNVWEPLATRKFVQTFVEGIDPKLSVVAATTGNLSATYNNSTGELVATSNGALVVDSIQMQQNQRVLVKSQANANENGIYDVAQSGSATTPWILVRSSDSNTFAKLNPGAYTYVESGTTNAGRGYVMNNDEFTGFGPTSSPTTDVTWAWFNFSTVLQGGEGITVSGTFINFDATAFSNGGSVALPLYSFGPDSDTGMFSTLPNTIGWSLGGTQYLDLSNMGLMLLQNIPLVANNVTATEGYFEQLFLSGSAQVNLEPDEAIAFVITDGVEDYVWINSDEQWVQISNLRLSTPLEPAYGGTGLSSYSTGALLFADSPSTLAELPPSTDGYSLKLVSGLPQWVKTKHVEQINDTMLFVDVVHNLNTEDVVASLRDVDGNFVIADIRALDANTVRVSFGLTGTETYTLIVLAG